MKKIISMLLVVIMIMSVTTITAFSATNDAGDKDYLFFSDFDAIHRCNTGDTTYYYDELYYHYVDENNPNSEIDWSIVYALLYAGNATSVKDIILDRILLSSSMNVCYTYGWALYDAKTKEFISIEDVDIDKYDGFEEAINELKIGNPFGDADFDGLLTISDATYIQRALANLSEYHFRDDLSKYGTWGTYYDRPLNYISDIDGDGERTVMDATAIQVKLAKK